MLHLTLVGSLYLLSLTNAVLASDRTRYQDPCVASLLSPEDLAKIPKASRVTTESSGLAGGLLVGSRVFFRDRARYDDALKTLGLRFASLIEPQGRAAIEVTRSFMSLPTGTHLMGLAEYSDYDDEHETIYIFDGRLLEIEDGFRGLPFLHIDLGRGIDFWISEKELISLYQVR